MEVLIFNVGSSSLKWTVLAEDDSIIAQGNERASGMDPAALRDTIERVGAACARASADVRVVGHRIVHGASIFQSSVRVDDAVRRTLEQLAALDALHMRPALSLLDAARTCMPEVPHVAAFDTAFHRTLSADAAAYALPHEWSTLLPQGVELRRYGFHGLSVEWSLERARRLLGELPRRVLVAHLGSGCSVTAVLDGKSIDTTMGFTPLDGLMMGTRPGALDPGLLIFLERECGLEPARLAEGLERRAGLLGVSGTSADLREVMAAAQRGDSRAQLAYGCFIACGRRGLGAMSGSLGGVDAVIFTGGMGEHSRRVRADLRRFLREGDEGTVRVLVVHAREDLIVARDARQLMRSG